MKIKEINSFSRFLNEESDTLEQIISNNERLRQELDKQLPPLFTTAGLTNEQKYVDMPHSVVI
jgi:hypothetical protein